MKVSIVSMSAVVLILPCLIGCSRDSIVSDQFRSIPPLEQVVLSSGVQLHYQSTEIQPGTSWLVAEFNDGRRQKVDGGNRYAFMGVKEDGDELLLKSTSWPPSTVRVRTFVLSEKGLYEHVRTVETEDMRMSISGQADDHW